ncbi:MAG: acylglycerol kinase family protein, partial [Ruminiclostridium sp.]|nr:acylglycerol kinase family protein [Ruminiclostridium sp.]
MAKYKILFNPYSDNSRGEAECKKIRQYYPDDELEFEDLTKIGDLNEFFGSLPEDATVVLSGGDGTINRFINAVDEKYFARDIYYYGTGTGNDFLFDLGIQKGSKPFLLNPYLINLPT